MPKSEERELGLVEAIVAARDQCPNAAVRAVALQALEALKTRESGALHQQAYFLLSAMQGWRGNRASQVHAALKRFLEAGDSIPRA